MKGRMLEEKIFKILMRGTTLIIIASLFAIFIAILRRGLPAMSWDMISKIPSGGYYLGKEGGLLNALKAEQILDLLAWFETMK